MGWSDGTPVFIPLSAPGDVVATAAVRRRRGVSYAEIGEILRASSLRRTPACPYFSQCGGCSWMHISYSSQVEWKGKILSETVRRIGAVGDFPSVKAVPSPEEFSWRYRIRLHHSNGALGFFKRGTHDLVSWEKCLVIPPWLNTAVAALREVMVQEGRNMPLESVDLAVSPVDNAVSILWRVEKGRKLVNAAKLTSGAEIGLLKSGLSCSCQAFHSGRPPTVGEFMGEPLLIPSGNSTTLASPGTFFQVNPHQNGNIVSRVLSVLRDREVESLLDLFCGNGNFSVPAARFGIRVKGVESSPGAVADARWAAKDGNIEIVRSDVESFLAAAPQPGAEGVLVDPPRAGLSPTVREDLVRLAPATILYVSCDPATLARDLKSFLQSGYNLDSLEAFDMFPNTAHIEALAVLVRS